MLAVEATHKSTLSAIMPDDSRSNSTDSVQSELSFEIHCAKSPVS